ncbi:hypothetical protein GQ53DRAFT_148697 [Thozetella sp. PMI_491]|nr:hypothetical protein GQ53DRAFT_148697 [Thozetella sp. PMI_491]
MHRRRPPLAADQPTSPSLYMIIVITETSLLHTASGARCTIGGRPTTNGWEARHDTYLSRRQRMKNEYSTHLDIDDLIVHTLMITHRLPVTVSLFGG